MQRIDSHQHFWKYNSANHIWIADNMSILKNDFLPKDLESILLQNNIDACVAVQVYQTEEETHFLLNLAEQYSFIKGVVGWVDFKNKNIEDRLLYFKKFKLLKGFRHILQAENDVFFSNPDFLNGISLLEKFGFTYDILIYPHQLNAALNFIKKFPKQPFVLDHIAKPNIKDKEINGWKSDIEKMAEHENVYCKISGLITEADWNLCSIEDFRPYLDVVVENFGLDRIMFGSDWPVCLLATSYEKWIDIVSEYFKNFRKTQQENIFGGNSIRFYDLHIT
jgi:L-fuconolactonase